MRSQNCTRNSQLEPLSSIKNPMQNHILNHRCLATSIQDHPKKHFLNSKLHDFETELNESQLSVYIKKTKNDFMRGTLLSQATGGQKKIYRNEDILSHLQNDIFGLDVDIDDIEGGVSRNEGNSAAETVLKVENMKLAPRMEIGSRKVAQRYAQSLR